jgi:hypothetical protein
VRIVRLPRSGHAEMYVRLLQRMRLRLRLRLRFASAAG